MDLVRPALREESRYRHAVGVNEQYIYTKGQLEGFRAEDRAVEAVHRRLEPGGEDFLGARNEFWQYACSDEAQEGIAATRRIQEQARLKIAEQRRRAAATRVIQRRFRLGKRRAAVVALEKTPMNVRELYNFMFIENTYKSARERLDALKEIRKQLQKKYGTHPDFEGEV